MATETTTQVAPAQVEITAKLAEIMGRIDAATTELSSLQGKLAEASAVIDNDESEDEEVLAAMRVRKMTRTQITTQELTIETYRGEIKALGDTALSPLTTALASAKTAFTTLLGASRSDESKRGECHAALDRLFAAQSALDTLRSELGLEADKPKGTRVKADGSAPAAPGVVYVNKDGDLRLRFGPDAAVPVLAVLAQVPGSTKRDHTFKWGERADSRELDIDKGALKQVLAVANQAAKNQPATAPKEERRAIAKLIKHVSHVIDGGETELAK